MRISSKITGYCRACKDRKLFAIKRVKHSGPRRILSGSCQCGSPMLLMLEGPEPKGGETIDNGSR